MRGIHRLTTLSLGIALGLAVSGSAADKPGRLSGTVLGVDKNSSEIMLQQGTAHRTVVFSSATKFMTVQVEGGKATIKGQGQTVETSVSVEDGGAKFSQTSVRYDTADGKYKMEEIQVGGTKTTLVFGNSGSGSKKGQPAEVR